MQVKALRCLAAVSLFVVLHSRGQVAENAGGEAPAPVEASEKSGLTSSPLLQPERRGVRVAVGIGRMKGDTTFQIGGRYRLADGDSGQLHFPLSELEFPLDLLMGTVEGCCDFRDKWTVRGKVSKNLTMDSGKTKDSDWGVFFGPNSLDIYSESDTDLKALLVDIGLRYRLVEKNRWSLSGGIGYAYQHFEAEVSNTVQSYPSLWWFGASTVSMSGKSAEYEVTYSIPYVEAVLQTRLRENVAVEARLGYSPAVTAEDEGNWLLRSKTFEGDCDGDALLLSLGARIDLRDKWFVSVSLDATSISTDGTQKQYFDNEFYASLEQKTESDQTLVALLIGKLF